MCIGVKSSLSGIIESIRKTSWHPEANSSLTSSSKSRTSGSQKRHRTGLQRGPRPLRPQGLQVQNRARRHRRHPAGLGQRVHPQGRHRDPLAKARQARRLAQKPRIRKARARRKLQRPPEDQARPGHPLREGEDHRSRHQRLEEEGPGQHPGRHRPRRQQRPRRPPGSDGPAARQRHWRRAPVHQLPQQLVPPVCCIKNPCTIFGHVHLPIGHPVTLKDE